MEYLVLVKILLVCLFAPMVTYTLDLFKGEGMIFEFYENWLQKLPKVMAKPLGLCANCFNVWVTIGLLTLFFTYPILATLIMGISLSNYLLKLIYE